MTTEQILNEENYLAHYGVLGMKWGVRRYETKSGNLTQAGKARYDSESYKKHGILKGLQSARTGPSRVIKRTIHDAKENHRINKEVKTINKERTKFAKEVKRRDKQNKHFGAKMGLRIGAAAAKTAISVAAGVGAAKLATEGGIAATLGSVGLGAAATFLRTSVTKTTNKAAYSLANRVVKDQYDVPVSKIPKKVSKEDVERWEEKEREEAKKLNHSSMSGEHLEHYGILGMKWGIRRFQNKDGSLTNAGRARYGDGPNLPFKKNVKKATSGKAAETTKPESTPKVTETDEELKARLMRNPNVAEVSKHLDKFSTAELNEMANRSNALQRMRQDARNEEMMNRQEKERLIAEKQDKIVDGIKSFKNFAEVLHTGVSVAKDLAWLGKEGMLAVKMTKSMKEKNYDDALDYLLKMADIKPEKPKEEKKNEDTVTGDQMRKKLLGM